MGEKPTRGFLARRLARQDIFGLHLTLGLLACLMLAGLFALLAAQVDGPQPPPLDYRIYQTLREHREHSPLLKFTVRHITDFGDVPVLLPLGMAVVGLSLIRRNWALATSWVAVVLLGVLLNDGAKDLFQRARPLVYDGIVAESSYSFPSGHSMAAMISYGLLGYLFLLALPPRRSVRGLALACLSLIVLIVGFSRMYLSAHWLTDVLGGFLLGAAWLALCIGLLECGRRRTILQEKQDDCMQDDGPE
jgi:undecaprenyl-diphosphatase